MTELPKKLSPGEEEFANHLRFHGIQGFVRELAFVPGRKFRFDFALPSHRIAVEVEGGTWSGGRHSRGKGFAADVEKYNLAALMGWKVFRFTTEMVTSGHAIDFLIAVLSENQS